MLKIYQQTDHKGVYLYSQQFASKPYLAVSVAVPPVPPGKLAQWETTLNPVIDKNWGEEGTGQWVIKDDHRKADLYQTDDGSKYELEQEIEGQSYDGIGPVPAWLTLQERPSKHHNWVDGAWVLDVAAELEDAKIDKLREIDQDRDQALVAGFTHNGNTFDSDAKSIQRINAIATLALMDPNFSTPYITKDNNIITLDAAAVGALGTAAAQHESSLVFQARTLKDQVLDATDKAAVDAIVWVAP